MRELAKQYDPLSAEARWVERWANEPFTADAGSDKPPFCIVIPPPNVTGNLHLGHAFDNTLIDTLVRFKRMNGFEALFQPGTDHAGISTQVQVERALRAEGLSQEDLGREAFLERMWAWKERYGGIILGQLQRLGISADWTRTRFTLDKGLSRAVRKQFVELFHRGLVYRGERIVNWDPESRTTLSDLEVDREDRPGKMYTLAYELENGGTVQIATVRPETIFADVAVAVHPDDARFTHLHGQKARIPLTERWVPVITDAAVEPDFGTGALKITPAHDPTDFEVGARHNLPRPSVIDLDARLTGEGVPEAFRGLDRFEARSAVMGALVDSGELIGAEDYTIPVGLSQRTRVPVEPILSTQWFFKMDAVAPQVLAALDAGEMRLTPGRYLKVNRDWLQGLRDWNISRQLWWGHRIPAWYDPDGNVVVPDPATPDLDPTDDPRYEGVTLTQDPDVFDTWFSSNLWPFSTLGWPDESDPFFKKFYPTAVMVTGYDILFFWVTKMQLAAYALLDEKPFTDIVLHGLVLDEHGQKMSKSKGNGIDPLEVMDAFGADALRFAMAHTSTGGQDIRWDARRVEMGRNFNTKLWNAARFAFINFGESVPQTDAVTPQTLADRWILSRLQRAVGEMTAHLDAFDLGAAARTAYDFVWSEFCDWYLEAAKPDLRDGNAATKAVLAKTLTDILKLLHPLVPFITSELYEAMGHEEQLGRAGWPQVNSSLSDGSAEYDFAILQELVEGVRDARATANVPFSRRISDIPVYGEKAKRVVDENRKLLEHLTNASFTFTTSASVKVSATFTSTFSVGSITVPLEGLVNPEEVRAKEDKLIRDLTVTANKSAQKLANPKFAEKAPPEVVAEERRRYNEANEQLQILVANRGKL